MTPGGYHKRILRPSKDILRQKYTLEKMTLKQIGAQYKASGCLVSQWLRHYGIPRRTSGQSLSAKYTGEKSKHWKGGRINNLGYVCIYSPNHPYRRKYQENGVGGYVAEHRLVMEKHLGRYLRPYEVVHHINGKKDDNRIENLELLPNNGVHNKKVQRVFQDNERLKKANVMLWLLVQSFAMEKVVS